MPSWKINCLKSDDDINGNIRILFYLLIYVASVNIVFSE